MKLSTAFHPETDGQSEITNQEMERYLRNYCNYQQDDWTEWLSIVEYASNASISISTGLSAFMANYEYESRMSFDPIDTNEGITRERIMKRKRVNIANKMKEIWNFTRTKLAKSQEAQKEYADRKRTKSPEYRVGQQVWLSTRNIKTTRPSKKLDHKMINLFFIKRVLKGACQLELPASMRIHDTFHTSLLQSVSDDPLPGQIQSPPPSIIVENQDEEEYELDDILDSRIYRGKVQYRVKWTGHLCALPKSPAPFLLLIVVGAEDILTWRLSLHDLQHNGLKLSLRNHC